MPPHRYASTRNDRIAHTLSRIAGAITAITVSIASPTLAAAADHQSAPAAGSSGSSGSSVMGPVLKLSDLSPIDELGRPRQQLLDQARHFATTTPLPDNLRATILAGVAFYEGSDKGSADVQLPENGPRFKQFYWPTVASKCINASMDSVGSGIAVPGPAEIPAPGAKPGETSFLFTALGTGKLAHSDMKVHWFNMKTLKFGTTALGYNGINPEGPATVSGVAETGSGPIVAVMDGAIDTIEKESNAHCSFIPTAAFFEVY
ncbi:MAG: hypothetical protein Q4D85_00090 [Corynebacterium sp.]|uniref:Rv1157c family protein n=1 Tax=Corynebacterium sp. TaxID=1720 RepID=UPI0026DDC47D|nr:hypothetical protein [Corynebacterium sp.]MDO5097125.1 hypothetical protein [Corynebacterium sp.]